MPPAFVFVTADGPSALRVRWSDAAIAPHEGSYGASYPVALAPGPASLLVALPALIALSRRGGEVRLVPELLRERGLSPVEQRDVQRALTDTASLIADTIAELYGERVELSYTLDAASVPSQVAQAASRNHEAAPEGLLFGGGAESLLTLTRLLERTTPRLISLCGAGWTGSDPDKNALKLAFDEHVAADLKLRLERIETSAYAAVTAFQPAWERGTKGPLFLANAIVFAPLALGITAPMIDAGVVSSLHLGSENDHAGYHTVYCLSPEFLHRMASAVAPLARFVPALTELSKAQIVRELWRRGPRIARHQSSCFSSHGERWCHACEKCFRSYALLTVAGADPAAVELDTRRLHSNAPRYARPLARLIAFSSYHRHVYYEIAGFAWQERRRAFLAILAPWLALAEAVRLRKKLGPTLRMTRA